MDESSTVALEVCDSMGYSWRRFLTGGGCSLEHIVKTLNDLPHALGKFYILQFLCEIFDLFVKEFCNVNQSVWI